MSNIFAPPPPKAFTDLHSECDVCGFIDVDGPVRPCHRNKYPEAYGGRCPGMRLKHTDDVSPPIIDVEPVP